MSHVSSRDAKPAISMSAVPGPATDLEPIELQPFNPLSRLEEFERLFPEELKLFELVGIHPLRPCQVINPYTKEKSAQDFTNIGEHCLAVAHCASRLAARMEQAGVISAEEAHGIVSRALVHDLTKPFEIMRRDAQRAGLPQEVYTVSAYENLKPLLTESGVSAATADYLVSAGSETGHNSLAGLLEVAPDGAVLLAQHRLAQKIVHLADDMTFTSIPAKGEKPVTAFLTCAERMERSEFASRYPFLFKEGLGRTADGHIVPLRDLAAPAADQEIIGSYHELQGKVATAIATELKNLLDPATSLDPDHFVKQLIVEEAGPKEASLPKVSLPELKAADVDFQAGLLVVNRTRRYVIPVPELPGGGEPLVHPEGSELAGTPIKKAPDGAPDRGIVFRNEEDGGWQAVRGNGKEAILINDVSPEQANLIASKISALAEGGAGLTADGIRSLLRTLSSELGMVDFYDKKRAEIPKDMVAVGADPNYVAVTKPTLHRAVLIEHGFVFDGPIRQTYPEGAVLLNDGQYTWGISSRVFQRNFKVVEGNQERPLGRLSDEFGARDSRKPLPD